MATSSIRMVKEPRGAGGKVTARKPSKPVSLIPDKGSSGTVIDSFKKYTGKENPKPTSRVLSASSQKPVLRAMPRINKPVPTVRAEDEPGARRSTSSVPRCRSSSPADFSRMLSDLRKQKADIRGPAYISEKGMVRQNGRLSGGKDLSGDKILERFKQKETSKEPDAKVKEITSKGTGVLRKNTDSSSLAANSVRISEREKGSEPELGTEQNSKCAKDIRALGDSREGKSRSSLSNASDGSGLRLSKEQRELDFVVKSQDGVIANEECEEESCFDSKPTCRVEKLAGGNESGEGVLPENTLDKLKVLEGLKDKGLNASGVNSGLRFSKEGGELDIVVKGQKGFIVKEEYEEQPFLVDRTAYGVDSVAEGPHEKSLNKWQILEGLKDKGLNRGVGLGADGLHAGSLDKLKMVECLREKGLNGEGVDVGASSKYSSNLYHKLAFLEGKVKRIESDIKRTKGMLDMSMPSESKAVLSDIHEKILGIEKAMCHALGNSDGTSDSVKTVENDNGQDQLVEKDRGFPSDNVKNLVKGLNGEELEARLFPHHKLLRNRASVKASSDLLSCQSLACSSKSKAEDRSSDSPDDNHMALKFLAPASEEQSEACIKDQSSVLGFCEIQETDDATTSVVHDDSKVFKGRDAAEVDLMANETIDEFDNQANIQDMILDEETEDAPAYQLNEIGRKISTGGWFVSESESVLLAHGDGSCSLYDIANREEKAEYKPPAGLSPNLWRDCWIIRAPGADGSSGRYVVAASAGNAMPSGFCSWDFYSKDVQAFHINDSTNTSRTVLGPLSNNIGHRRNLLSPTMCPGNQQWWFTPCGPLIISAASCQRDVFVHDIRDGEQIMTWEVQKPILKMDYSSPLQWRSRRKVVIAESEAVTLCDVSTLVPQELLSISLGGQKISALHVNNTDAELGGGIRQRVRASEAGNDGVFCTNDSINIMDFRCPSGVGLKIPRSGASVQSVLSHGDSIYLGCSDSRSTRKKQTSSMIQHFSARKQRLVSSYTLPQSNAHSHHAAITQVWGNSDLVMCVCGLGLFVFHALEDDDGVTQKVKEIVGPDDMYSPSFDYSQSCALLVSRDRPALWRHLL